MRKTIPVLLLAVILLSAKNAHAYIDPGTGGMLYQIAFATFSMLVGMMFVPMRFFKNILSKIKARFSKSRT